MADVIPIVTHVEPRTDPAHFMKACTWQGNQAVKLAQVNKPLVTDPQDAIVRITATTICGSDLHLFTGEINKFGDAMHRGDITGHECMGIVEDVGPAVTGISKGQRVVVSFVVSCGTCRYCKEGSVSLCDNTNPSLEMQKMYGGRLSGMLGYSHLTGGYPGGQAEYVRVAFADNNLLPVPDNLADEQVLFLSDIICTGWHANELGEVSPGKVVCVWGCGPVGMMAAAWAKYRGASRVIIIDKHERRLQHAKQHLGVDTLNRNNFTDVVGTIQQLVPGGPDVCIECVGFRFPVTATQKLQRTIMAETDTTDIVDEMVRACRKGGNLAVIGDYFGYGNGFPIGPLMEKAITFRGGQAYVQKYWRHLLDIINRGQFDPTFVISHRMSLDNIEEGYHYSS